MGFVACTRSDIMKVETVYFESGGKHNTEVTLELVKEKALEHNIKNVVVASIRGYAAEKALEVFSDVDIKLAIVGCNGCDACPLFSEEIKTKVENKGHKVIFAPEGSIPYPPEVELAYRRICEGMKVCVFVAMAVAEAELVPSGQEIIAVTGTGWKGYEKGGGSDTAIITQALKSREFFSYEPLEIHKLKGRKIKEIMCKPR